MRLSKVVCKQYNFKSVSRI